jgi:hypothetical protein
MNERIKNLSKKAWLLAHEANDQAEEDEGEELTEAEFGNVFQQKFAELIVREVFTVIENEQYEIYEPVIQKVKQHFGVEE